MKSILILLFLSILCVNPILPQKAIHVFVALCDNLNQGIVPVPSAIGNGQDPTWNLYWGAGYGIKHFFDKKTGDWVLLKSVKNPESPILEKLLFKHSTEDYYLLAEAYDGANIKEAIEDFVKASGGNHDQKEIFEGKEILFGGQSDLVAYVGHNGLMEFEINPNAISTDGQKRDAIILACYSKAYFSDILNATEAKPIVWTSGLMAPEAYTLKWALDGYVLGESAEQIRERAAQAYNHYQKCGIRGARNLLITGY